MLDRKNIMRIARTCWHIVIYFANFLRSMQIYLWHVDPVRERPNGLSLPRGRAPHGFQVFSLAMILGKFNMESFDQGKLVIAVRMALAMGVLITAGSAFAQDASGNTDASSKAAKSLETVVVTGSRIRSVDVATAQPVFTMTQADIKKTGMVNVGDILQNLTVVGAPDFSKADVLASDSEAGGQY
ncbi:MAG: hypothetical protein WAM90_04310, partial [Rhodanobacter sp.]